jgi:hypothetical protein
MQAPFYPNHVSETEGYFPNRTATPATPSPKKTRVVVSSKEMVGDNFDLKKMIGILIILIIVVFFTVLIGIVITLMKPGCKCNNMLPTMMPQPMMPQPMMPQQYFGQPNNAMNSMMNGLPFV